MQPRIIVDEACQTGEGPLWHPEEKRLYWVDIPTGRLFRYNPADGTHETFTLDAPVGGFTLQANGELLLFMARGRVCRWREGVIATLIDEIPAEVDGRFNDVIADPAGRVFCGTMPTAAHRARLYRLDTDGTLTTVLEDVGLANGLGFTPDGNGLYFTDTPAREIGLFDYDPATGEISNRRVFVRVADDEGAPDGLTVDAEGCVWSAQWGGACVVRYTPDGRELLRIPLPTPHVTSLTFAGPDDTDIYITTAGGHDKATHGPAAGALFHLNLGIRGVSEFRSRVGISGRG